jgi:hypothetical protein
MKPDDLDQILVSEKPIIPSSSFEANVMARIQTEASPRFENPFPWIPFTLMAFPFVILCFLLCSTEPAMRAVYHLFEVLSKWIVTPPNPALSNAIQAVLASLLGTLVLIWLSFRLTGVNR